MDQLAIAIQLLLDNSEERFIYERQLRMFQFQCWLLDTSEQESSFRRSAIKFGGAVLSSEMSRVRTRIRGLGTRDCILLAIAGKNTEGVINHCFALHGRKFDDIYDLMKVDRFPLWKKAHDDAFATIKKLNTVLEVRLRLHAAKSAIEPRQNVGNAPEAGEGYRLGDNPQASPKRGDSDSRSCTRPNASRRSF